MTKDISKTLVTVCIPTRDKDKIDLKRMNLDVIPNHKILLEDCKGLGKARTKLMERVKTDWFVFIDDDIRIDSEWWDKISKYIDQDKLGAVSGLAYPDEILPKIVRWTLLKLRGDKDQRGFTHNTLIRTEAVKGIELERESRLEDLELQEKIRERGWEWILDRNIECLHLDTGRRIVRDALRDFRVLVKERGFAEAIKTI